MPVIVRKGDLFAAADQAEYKDFALAHCISEDCVMGKGIAVEFKKRFGGVSDLKKQVASGKKTGSVCTLSKKRFVYYLITKKIYRNKPTYESLRSSLEDMKAHMLENEVRGVIMPKIGCGLDRLEWSRVYKMLNELFKTTDLQVIVYAL